MIKITKVLFSAILLFLLFPNLVSAATIPFTVTTGVSSQPVGSDPAFLTVNYDINYQGGEIVFSGNPDGTGTTAVDDGAIIQVTRPDGTSDTTTLRYDNGCSFIFPKTPQDLSYLFKPGLNQVQIKLIDVCGGSVGSLPIYLVYTNAPEPPPTKTPIIIVPGIAASLNYGILTDRGDFGWNWMYFAESSWRQFIDSLEKAGYQKDKDYFIAFYDWRKTNDWTNPDPGAALPAKKYLTGAIDKAKAANPGISKVNVVAHSMGGLVVRSYVESPFYRGDIDKAFLIGTPNAGSTFAYYAWEGAEIPPNWDPIQKAGLDTMINLLSFNYLENHYSMIHNHIKSIKDMLPIGYDYLSKNNNLINWLYMQETNNFLKNISNSQITPTIFANKGIQLTNLMGKGQDTWKILQVQDFNHPYLWLDGKPLGFHTIADGDNTVLTSSSFLPNMEYLSLDGKHGNLPNIASQLIFSKLGINYIPSNLAKAPDKVMVAWVASPVSLEVIDSQGNSVGESLVDPSGEMKWVFVENPTGDYKIHLVGTGNGPYHVGVDYYTDSITDNTKTEGIAVTGAVLDYNFHLDPLNEHSVSLLPEDSIPPTTTIQAQGTSGKNNWYLSGVNISLSATDNTGGTGVDKTEYSFDNTNWQIYNSPFIVNQEGITTIYYRSVDLVGNQEQTKQTDIKIDRVAPEAIISIDSDLNDLVVKGKDQNLTSVQRIFNTETQKPDDALYIITDEAGNTLRMDVRDRDKYQLDKFKIYSLQYNNDSEIILENNFFNIIYQDKKSKQTIKEQNFELNNEIRTRIKYDISENKSTILIKESEIEKIKEVRNGLVLLILETDKGKLEANY